MATTNVEAGFAEAPRTFRRYSVTGHASGRFDDPRRPITKPRARTAIENGEVERNPVAPDANEWRFRHRIEGCDVVVTCGGPQEDPTRVGYRVVTAFVDVVDPGRAWSSDEWSKDEVSVATLLQCLNAGYPDAVDGFYLARVDVHDPIEFGGHAIVCNQGHDTPFCIRCRHTSIDGDDYKRRECLPPL